MKVGRVLYVGMVSLTLLLGGCSTSQQSMASNPSGEITVVSRETGSGTRDAFIEQVGLLEKDDIHRIDQTTLEAIVQNSTAGVLSTVAGLDKAIGYVSLGTLSDIVQPVAIEGVLPTTETILAGDYRLQRPFVICWPNEIREEVRDFMAFINSKEGQDIIKKTGYVPTNPNALPYQNTSAEEGLVTVVGSTSVTPVMEQLAEQYQEIHSGVQIDIISNGSTAGITAVQEGTADIGMSSRALNSQEIEQMNSQAIALDGIVIIVNQDNPLNTLTLQEVRDIFKGDVTDWQDLAQH
ncbi:phosphate ABC transporter substrate-binding protein, PhoT family [Granulicatella balaenopterae]|uniref:Phosphate ABC transporter substrate-binding protein, PhoT family n=1 Tax=Granulicatella balaenopterae TaxID=137733 RepID=A0A1H9M1I3_9LACT|nr:substrate-binding domain-containing protein [Granulicatella balaenopterae]SER17504.1 phosphate ABC transporter substrate-binding protein, PhoT family [Granulicatella balaenopterae]